MKIIIKETNKDRITKELDKIQKRTTARNIYFSDLLSIINDVDKNLGIAKNKMIGISVDADYNAQDFPNAYKYIPESTHVIIERMKSGWALMSVNRSRCRTPKKRYIVNLTDDAKTAIIESKMCFE